MVFFDMLIFSNGKIRYKVDASAKGLSINNYKKDSLKSGFLSLEFAVFHFFFKILHCSNSFYY